MMTRSSLVSLAALALSLGAAGCATPDVSAHGLGLKRVVIYRNGVGYFERQGKVDVPEVTFRVRHERVGDFLATLAVIERGGSSVRAASFPVTTKKKRGQVEGGAEVDDDDDDDRRYEVLIKPPPGKPEAKKDPLDTVRLSLDGKEHDLQVGYVAETPVWRPSYRLVIESATPAAAGAPPKPAKADLQAWGIVQNLSGEDWKGVRLSLVAGAPLAFQATLEKAVIPSRPVVTDQGEVIASVPTSETSLATRSEMAPPAPPPPPSMAPMPSAMDMPMAEKAAEEQDAKKDVAGRKRPKAAPAPKGGARGLGGAATGHAYGGAPAEAAMAPAAPPAQPVWRPEVAPSMPRNVSALAAVAVDAGTTRYDLPFTVDVPNESATMVLLVAKEVPGEAIFLFAPDGGVPASHAHPFRVARFTNDTQGLLEKGPIAVFEKGAFLGQGMVDPLPPGATATVPFALERALAVESSRAENEEGARLAKIESGQIEIERDWVTHTKYTVKSGSDLDARMLVKHPRMAGTRLVDAPKGTEDNVGTGSALVPVQVPKRSTATLDVDERRVLRRGVDWLSQLAADAVKAYTADPRADQAVVGQLRAAWEARDKLRAALDEQAKLSGEKGQLESQSDDLRRNLKAIEKNKSADGLRKDLTDRLAKASARLDEITKRLIVVEMTVSEQQIRFRDLVTNVKMLKPLPPA
jgi:hypothetical protein